MQVKMYMKTEAISQGGSLTAFLTTETMILPIANKTQKLSLDMKG